PLLRVQRRAGDRRVVEALPGPDPGGRADGPLPLPRGHAISRPPRPRLDADKQASRQQQQERSMSSNHDEQVAEVRRWFQSPRFPGLKRRHTAREVVEQRGTTRPDYAVARETAAAFHDRLRQLFDEKKSITSFGPYSPGQAVAMKRMGIEGIYLGGWATSAKGGTSEDPGPDLATYPLSQVPDEAATLVRALLSAEHNQPYFRPRVTRPP